MEELHIYTLAGSDIEHKFEERKGAHPRAHIKQLHYSTCYRSYGGVADSVLIEYTEES